MAGWWHWLAELVWWLRLLISVAAFVGGALLAGWMLALVMLSLGRQTSKRLRFLTRLGGGTLAGVLTWLFLQFAPPGTGSGSQGTGGGFASNQVPHNQVEPPEKPPPPLPPEQTRGPLSQGAGLNGRWVLRIKLLGPDSVPKYQEPDKYFAVLDALPRHTSPLGPPAAPILPGEPLSAEGVLAAIKQLQSQGTVEAIELHVTPFSTSLRHQEVGKLRRLLMDAEIRFSYPDPDKPTYSRLIDR